MRNEEFEDAREDAQTQQRGDKRDALTPLFADRFQPESLIANS
jgi:hypothetical protein